ncbi:hypothetical protein ACPEEZ_02255 [Frigoribacterium sp. 2-23]|uniref:hypothetical protein n=1 Tax=Frigoribacterium sp. 2-23 TaxID=3415006 RepID=UPI003C6FA65C
MLDRNKLEPFKTALTKALRTTTHADAKLNARFIELRPGIIGTLETNVNHLVTGRRGVGKSTTLAILQQSAERKGKKVIFVDVESHKSRDYPDVLIEIILDVLRAIKPKRSHRRRTWRVRGRIRELTRVLLYLRDAGNEVREEAAESSIKSRGGSIALSGKLALEFNRLSGRAHAEAGRSSRKVRSTTRLRTKDELLRDLAPSIAQTLEDVTDLDASTSLILVLDDFYFVPKQTQPLVLDHLHGITKKSNVWLKIGSVQSRTQTFADGDPPLGMQPPHDVQHLSLDVGLADFHTAKTFLEEVAAGVLAPEGFKLSSVLTEKARERAVLIAGGAVSRDYFDLLISAADAAWEEVQRADKANAPFAIDAEHIQAAAGVRLARKQADLRNDAGRDASKLERRFEDIVKFTRNRDTFFFLVRQEHMDLEFGREILELEDLRFVHRIMTTRPNSGNWRGVDTVVFMVDIPAIVTKRMRKAPLEFWKPGQVDKLRRAEWVYSPEWQPQEKLQSSSEASSSKEARNGSTEVTLFD